MPNLEYDWQLNSPFEIVTEGLEKKTEWSFFLYYDLMRRI